MWSFGTHARKLKLFAKVCMSQKDIRCDQTKQMGLLPSGNLLHIYSIENCTFIVDLPIKDCDFPVRKF